MNGELKSAPLSKLAEEYRAIQAPPAFLRDVLEAIETQTTSQRWWFPVSAAFASLALLVILVGYLDTGTEQLNPPQTAAKSLPNMSSLTSLSIEKPGNVSLSQLNIRSLSMPAMPSAPEIEPTSKPRFDNDHEARIQNPKERENVYS